MEILARNGKWRPPTCAVEYFLVLFCNRKKIVCRRDSTPGLKAWKLLSPAEQKMFVDKFEKWQAENHEKITGILEHAELFLKKKTTEGKRNIPSNMNTTQEDCDVSLRGSVSNISTNSHSYIQPNADLDVSKRDDLNVEFNMDDYDDQSESMMNPVYDDTPTGNLEVPKQFYTASVIDEDIDEPTAPETNETITKTALPEPMLPTDIGKRNIPSNMNTTQEDCDVSLRGSVSNISTNSHSYIQPNADLDVSKRDDLNVEFNMDDYDDQSESMMNPVYDDTPTGNLEVPKQFYTASVIDEDIDEPTAPETNETITKTALPEPMLPTVMRPTELFRIIKQSGTRPELATVEWKDVPMEEKRTYSRAIHAIKKDYLKNYEQYLESLSSPELFKHYIKFKKEN